MPALQVKDCPENVYEQLRACAGAENRSISQQALTIIEDYLFARGAERQNARASAPAAEMGLQTSSDSRGRGRYARSVLSSGFASRHRQVVERLEGLSPIPVSESAPRADELLAAIRKEEAR